MSTELNLHSAVVSIQRPGSGVVSERFPAAAPHALPGRQDVVPALAMARTLDGNGRHAKDLI